MGHVCTRDNALYYYVMLVLQGWNEQNIFMITYIKQDDVFFPTTPTSRAVLQCLWSFTIKHYIIIINQSFNQLQNDQ